MSKTEDLIHRLIREMLESDDEIADVPPNPPKRRPLSLVHSAPPSPTVSDDGDDLDDDDEDFVWDTEVDGVPARVVLGVPTVWAADLSTHLVDTGVLDDEDPLERVDEACRDWARQRGGDFVQYIAHRGTGADPAVWLRAAVRRAKLRGLDVLVYSEFS